MDRVRRSNRGRRVRTRGMGVVGVLVLGVLALAWFGTLAWPPFVPERPGFDPGNVPSIPAEERYALWIKGSGPEPPARR